MTIEKKVVINEEIRQKNRSDIYHMLRTEGPLSRQEIVERLRLSLPTVRQYINDLTESGLVQKTGTMGNTGGRNASTYSIVQNARTAIGLDITRNEVVAVAVNLQGELITVVPKRVSFSFNDAYYRVLGQITEEVIEAGNLDRSSILGVGIGVPGLITADHQTIFYGEILKFTGLTCGEMSKYIPFPTALFNDANAAGFAESWVNPDVPNSFYMMLSNNVGGAIYLGHNQYFGDNIRSAEVGHLIIHQGGKRCYCGQKGCCDAYCSATVLSSYTNGNLPAFFRQLKSGDKELEKVWARYLKDLAETVANVRMLFDCKVIIGGYVGAYMDAYLDDLKKLLSHRNSFEDEADYLMPCFYKTHSIAAGSAMYFLFDFLHSI